MKTNAAKTSINAYHRLNPDLISQQEKTVISFIAKNGACTIGEIAHGLGMEKSTISARQNNLREKGVLCFDTRRKCRVSGITCQPLDLISRRGK